MISTLSPQPASDRVTIEIQRGIAPAIRVGVALSEIGSLSAIAHASVQAMGFTTFVAINRLRRSPELWLAVSLAGLRIALAPAFDHRDAAEREERLLQQAAADAAVARAARIAAIDRLRAGLMSASSRVSLARLPAGPAPRPAAPLPTPSS
ncbi:MAG: hypothetical protein GEV13_28595 [Rhodospirillales bacterium]|nr:hypothetical protein [Rhodospirillales bacterium]